MNEIRIIAGGLRMERIKTFQVHAPEVLWRLLVRRWPRRQQEVCGRGAERGGRLRYNLGAREGAKVANKGNSQGWHL